MAQISAKVLRNRGVPVEVYKVEETDDGQWVVVRKDDGTPQTEERHLRFDFNVIADLEEAFGGTQEWQDALGAKEPEAGTGTVEAVSGAKTGSAIRKTFAIAWNEPERKVGSMLVVGNVVEYGIYIGLAWGIANGLDPTDAAKRLTEALQEVKALRAGMVPKDDESTGSTGEK